MKVTLVASILNVNDKTQKRRFLAIHNTQIIHPAARENLILAPSHKNIRPLTATANILFPIQYYCYLCFNIYKTESFVKILKIRDNNLIAQSILSPFM